MLYKDAANAKSNQQNLGTIRSSNLCTEIIEYTSPDEVAVCNLASIAIPKFVKEDGTFDHDKLFEISYQVTKNLNKIIDRNYYPVVEARNSNFRHRPIGIGVQGLADAFILMRYPFDSEEAKALNKEVFETIYYAACTASKILLRRKELTKLSKDHLRLRANFSLTFGVLLQLKDGSGTFLRAKSRSMVCVTRY